MATTKTKQSSPQYLLLIWEMLPEEIRLYLIPRSEINDEQFATLVHACGKTANCDDLSGDELRSVMRINNALCEQERHLSKEYDHPDFRTNWSKHKVTTNKPIDAVITHVVRCGFLL